MGGSIARDGLGVVWEQKAPATVGGRYDVQPVMFVRGDVTLRESYVPRRLGWRRL
jgi:hypothetical protein